MSKSYILAAAFDASGLNGLSTIFKVIIIAIIYIIIFYALRLMYKDMKNGDRKQVKRKRQFGLEVVECGSEGLLRIGSVIPLNREVTIGRKDDNTVVLKEGYVSSHHAKIFLKNTSYILQDLNSTNGTVLNGDKILEKEIIKSGDEIKIGTLVFKVIG